MRRDNQIPPPPMTMATIAGTITWSQVIVGAFRGQTARKRCMPTPRTIQATVTRACPGRQLPGDRRRDETRHGFQGR
jgi:hypothetical protein